MSRTAESLTLMPSHAFARSVRWFPLLAIVAVTGCMLSAAGVSASLLVFTGTSSDGHAVSGTAEFTFHPAADTVTVTLTNTTATTLDAGELFTGLDFGFGGLVPTLTSDTGIQRTVAANGSYIDTVAAQDLSWSLASLGGGGYQLNFSPNAKDAVLGPPTAGSYSGANGSIKGNTGHNPFAAQMAVFELNVPQLADDTPLSVTTFRFGTGLNPAVGTITPEPATWLLLLVGAAALWRRPRT